MKEVPGAHELLDRLEGPLCVCSNSSSERLRITMERTRLWDRFKPYIFSAGEVGDQEAEAGSERLPLRRWSSSAATRARPSSSRTSVFGVTAARAAGARVIGFTGASHAWPGLADLLTEAGAETVVKRLSDIPKVAEAFAAWDGVVT